MSTERKTGNAGAIEAANLLAGDKPTWSKPTDTTAGPSGPASGVSVLGALKTRVVVQLRRESSDTAPRRWARITFPIFDAATTYAIEINGDAYSTSQATLAALLSTLVAAINVGKAGVCTATPADANDDETNDSIDIVGDIDADFAVVAGKSGGTGTIAAEVDASTAAVTVWGRPKANQDLTAPTVRPTSWVVLGTAAAPSGGYTELFDTAGIDRVAVAVVGAKNGSDGTVTVRQPDVWVGPHLLGS